MFPVPGQSKIWAALDVSLTFLAWEEGKVGGLLSTSSDLSLLQPITQQAPREVLSPNQHHANSDRCMYLGGPGEHLELGSVAPQQLPHLRSFSKQDLIK